MPLRTLITPDNPALDGRRVLSASLVATRLDLHWKGTSIASATGFVDLSSEGPVLITNRHVFTGRDQTTNKPLDLNARVPDEIVIWFRRQPDFELGSHRQRLFDEAFLPLWREHPDLQGRADIASLPLLDPGASQFFPRPGYVDDLPSDGSVLLLPSSPVAIVGFPFGRHTSGFPVWTAGTIASEAGFDYDGLPVMLVDARTRPAQSGSPVFLHSYSGMVITSGGPTMSTQPVTYFLGIYSGRIHPDSDIGMVWRPEVLAAVLNRGVPSTAMDPDGVRNRT